MPERPKGAVCKIAGVAYGGSNPPPPTVCDVSGHRSHVSRDIVPCSAYGLVVPIRIEHELPEQLSVLAHDPHVEPGHQHEHARPAWRRPTLMWCSRLSWRSVTPPPRSSRSRRTRQCAGIGGPVGAAFGRAGVGLCRRATTDRPVRPHLVVVGAEPVELGLQLLDRSCPGLLAEPPLEGLVEPLHLPAGLRVIRARVVQHDPQPAPRGPLEEAQEAGSSGATAKPTLKRRHQITAVSNASRSTPFGIS
jgi:hypothetical protein